jgi:hypothetical protein
MAAPAPSRPARTRLWAAVTLVLSSTLLAVATLLPWANVTLGGDEVTITGWENLTGAISDGPLHFVVAVLSVICGGLAIGGRHGAGVRAVAVIGGLVSLSAGVLRCLDYLDSTERLDGATIDGIAVGWGLYLVVAAALLISGSALLLRKG